MKQPNKILNAFSSKYGQIAVLIDPDKVKDEVYLKALVEKALYADVDYFFVGGSTVSSSDFNFVIQKLKSITDIPVVIFPGSSQQVSGEADAILYLSLISGRNPEYLIGQHVQSAEEIIALDLEVIPTGYILIDGGKQSSVAYVSQTTPIPRDKESIAYKTALAGSLLGKSILFFDAGSGAEHSVPFSLLQKVTSSIQLPTIVGGGIRSIESIQKYTEAKANVIVIGNHIEESIDFLLDIKNYKLQS